MNDMRIINRTTRRHDIKIAAKGAKFYYGDARAI